jgi:hypothetical protein
MLGTPLAGLREILRKGIPERIKRASLGTSILTGCSFWLRE